MAFSKLKTINIYIFDKNKLFITFYTISLTKNENTTFEIKSNKEYDIKINKENYRKKVDILIFLE